MHGCLPVRTENLSGHPLPRRSATCASPRQNTAEIDFPSQPPPHLTSFASVENLMLNLTMNATSSSDHSHASHGQNNELPAFSKAHKMHRCLSSGSLSRIETSFSVDSSAPPQTNVHISKTHDADGKCNCSNGKHKPSGYSIGYTKPQLSFEEIRTSTNELNTMSLGRRHHKSSPSKSHRPLSSSTSTTRLHSDSEAGDYNYGYTVVLATTPKRKDKEAKRSSSNGHVKSNGRVIQNDPTHYDTDSSDSRPNNPPPYVPPPSYNSLRSSISSSKGLATDSDSSYSSARSTGYSPFGPGKAYLCIKFKSCVVHHYFKQEYYCLVIF